MKKASLLFAFILVVSLLATGLQALAADAVLGTLDNFDGYADDAALRKLWSNFNGDGSVGVARPNLETTAVDSGKALRINVDNSSGWGWLNIGYNPGGIDFPEGTTKLQMWISSEASEEFISALQFTNYSMKFTIKPGENVYTFNLADFKFEGTALTYSADDVGWFQITFSPDTNSGTSLPDEDVFNVFVDSIVFLGTAPGGGGSSGGGGGSSGGGGGSPKTGDNIAMLVFASVGLVSCTAFMVALRKKARS